MDYSRADDHTLAQQNDASHYDTHVREGSKTEVAPLQPHFRFTLGNGHGQRINWSLARRIGLKIPPLRFPAVRSLQRCYKCNCVAREPLQSE
jgi:hypothetical protein